MRPRIDTHITLKPSRAARKAAKYAYYIIIQYFATVNSIWYILGDYLHKKERRPRQSEVFVKKVHMLFAQVVGQCARQLLYIGAGRVDHQIVVLLCAPLLGREELVVLGAALIDFAELFAQLTLAEVLAVGLALDAAGNLAESIGVYEYAEGLLFAQYVVRAATDYHAIRLFGQLFKQLMLLGVNRYALLEHGVGHGVEGLPYVYRECGYRTALGDVPHILLGHIGALGYLGNDLLIVIGDAHLFGKPASKLASATAEFTADCNYSSHILTPLRQCLF